MENEEEEKIKKISQYIPSRIKRSATLGKKKDHGNFI